jgi:hypothetical protein
MSQLSEDELHQLAMTTVGQTLEADGYEFLAVNSAPKKRPSVCVHQRQSFAFCSSTSCAIPAKSK